jgi:hypothetical protein
LGWLHRGIAYWRSGNDERVVILTAFGQMIALDAKTGMPVPSFGDHGHVDLTQGLRRPIDRDYYTMTSPPVIVRDVIVIGSSVMDWCTHRPSPPGDVRGSHGPPVHGRNVPGTAIAGFPLLRSRFKGAPGPTAFSGVIVGVTNRNKTRPQPVPTGASIFVQPVKKFRKRTCDYWAIADQSMRLMETVIAAAKTFWMKINCEIVPVSVISDDVPRGCHIIRIFLPDDDWIGWNNPIWWHYQRVIVVLLE